MAESFRSQLQDNPPGMLVEVPPHIVEALGGGKRPAVRVVLPRERRVAEVPSLLKSGVRTPLAERRTSAGRSPQ